MSMNVRRVETGRGDRWEVRWSVYADDGTRKERSKRFDTKAKADKYKHQVEATKHDEPAAVETGKKSVSYWADAWLLYRAEQVATGQIRPSSLHGNTQIVTNTIKPMLGERRVRSLTPDDVDAFVSRVQIERGVTVATAKHHFHVLRQILAYAVRKGAIRINPADGVRRSWKPAPSTAPFHSVALSKAEVAHLASTVEARHPDTPWALLIRFMAFTGLRAGEVAGLDVRDLWLVGGREGSVTVRQIRLRGHGTRKGEWTVNPPKTGKPRRVPLLTSALREDMASYLAQHPRRDDPHAPLWPGTSKGRVPGLSGCYSEVDYEKAWDRDPFYRRVFRPALKEAGLPPMRLHDLRHTAGSIMLSDGINDLRTARYLGHSPELLHRIYAHILDDDWAADMNRIEELPKLPMENVIRLA